MVPITWIERLGKDRRPRVIGGWPVCTRCLRVFFDDPHIHNHVVSKILISSDESVSLLVLERDAFGPTRTSVQTVKVLDGCYD